ncbi:MAG: hypothetical protein NXI20_18820 [bacterium]|nr:hypothetical protein [bacterium]
MIKIYINTLIISLLLCGCNQQVRTAEARIEQFYRDSVNVGDKKFTQISLDPISALKGFSKDIVGSENVREHHYNLAENRRNLPIYPLEIFGENLEQIIAFSDKRKTKSFDPSYHELFLAFAFDYGDTATANAAFDTLTNFIQKNIYQADSLAVSGNDSVKKFQWGVGKSGGLFCQVERYTLLLIKTCGDPPTKGKWSDYEKGFLKNIFPDQNNAIVFNAHCGDMMFICDTIALKY